MSCGTLEQLTFILFESRAALAVKNSGQDSNQPHTCNFEMHQSHIHSINANTLPQRIYSPWKSRLAHEGTPIRGTVIGGAGGAIAPQPFADSSAIAPPTFGTFRQGCPLLEAYIDFLQFSMQFFRMNMTRAVREKLTMQSCQTQILKQAGSNICIIWNYSLHTPHLSRKKLSTNSPWDFEYVLQTMNPY